MLQHLNDLKVRIRICNRTMMLHYEYVKVIVNVLNKIYRFPFWISTDNLISGNLLLATGRVLDIQAHVISKVAGL